ncbi:tripartite tricarboxylate transporter substrate binding protein [Candidimonas humi]|uniref:Bug family tripartite tricarboxylate transporter substrate binding protein n=1 Tax=Candidimonas humi TaxID=683355 RepID=A0ABV8P050_9BURK|nr:tripartite tricarboxylate transporter substrate binding protein [Candidimonas humi]MBV6303978.1 tripartite tricarboxylate transporter substrate binding protein [Candidimonas humi]
MKLRAYLIAAASVACVAGAPATALAKYPDRPITLIVPFTPGGSTDILARAVGDKLGKAWGQTVIIENVPGAGGVIGTQKAAQAKPDGYTLMMGHIGTLGVNPSLYAKKHIEPLKMFDPVAWVARVPNVLVVNPKKLPTVHNLADLIAYAKQHPGQIDFGSGGNGSAAHTATEYLMLKAGINMTHVPYRGTGPAVTDLIAGQNQLMFTGVPAVIGFIKSGQLLALGVSSTKRVDALPNVPTVAESGLPGLAGFQADQWYGIVAPAGTPRAIVDQLNTEINRIISAPELKKRFEGEGAIPNPTTPEAFKSLIRSEMARWKEVVEKAHMAIN